MAASFFGHPLRSAIDRRTVTGLLAELNGPPVPVVRAERRSF
jgi:hypothetical protein